MAVTRGLAGEYKIVGPDQGELAILEKYLARLGPRLSYEGALPGDAVVRRLAICDVFVLPSLDEPWGNVLVAAVALGKPVVVTASAALSDRLLRAGCAAIVPDGDVVGIAEQVDEILTNGPLRARMVAAAKAFLRRELSNEVLSRRLRNLILGMADTSAVLQPVPQRETRR